MYKRKQLFQGAEQESLFLWGARQTGKSTLLKINYPESLYLDLLKSDTFERFRRNPSLLRETVLASDRPSPVIIDEIQRIPELLNEIHWLIENSSKRFILSGSSPRKIIRSGANLLGGRALRYELYPLSFSEIPDFELLQALNRGLLPRHYLSTNHERMLSAYIGSYLRDEILAEAKIRNIASFSQFLEAAAFSNGEIVNYTNIAAECGVSSPTIAAYFQILEDTLIGRFLPSYRKKPKRRVIRSPKFYYFDIGIVNYLLKRKSVVPGSETFGNAFEHLIYHELYCYSNYSGANFPISYWRTASQIEVDFILGDNQVAVEVKATRSANSRHVKGLLQFADEYRTDQLILVSNDPMPRKMGAVTVLPWQHFLDRLWNGEVIR